MDDDIESLEQALSQEIVNLRHWFRTSVECNDPVAQSAIAEEIRRTSTVLNELWASAHATV